MKKRKATFLTGLAAAFILSNTFAQDAVKTETAPAKTETKAPAQANPLDALPEIVAEVGDRKITKQELIKSLGQVPPQILTQLGPAKFKQLIKPRLESMVDDILLKKLVDKSGIKVTADDVKIELKVMLAKMPKEQVEQMKMALKQQGMTLDQYVDKIAADPRALKDLALKKWAEKNIISKVTDADIKKYYEDHQTQFLNPPSHILIMPKRLMGEEDQKKYSKYITLSASAKSALGRKSKIDSDLKTEETLSGKSKDEGKDAELSGKTADVKGEEKLSDKAGDIKGKEKLSDKAADIKGKEKLSDKAADIKGKEHLSGKTQLFTDTDSLAKNIAENILADLKAGKIKFEDAAASFSHCASARKKGKLEAPVTKEGNNYIKEFKDATLKLKPGETSGIVKSPFGYHIIKKDSSEYMPLDEVKEKVKMILVKEQFEKMMEVQRAKNNVKINL